MTSCRPASCPTGHDAHGVSGQVRGSATDQQLQHVAPGMTVHGLVPQHSQCCLMEAGPPRQPELLQGSKSPDEICCPP